MSCAGVYIDFCYYACAKEQTGHDRCSERDLGPCMAGSAYRYQSALNLSSTVSSSCDLRGSDSLVPSIASGLRTDSSAGRRHEVIEDSFSFF